MKNGTWDAQGLEDNIDDDNTEVIVAVVTDVVVTITSWRSDELGDLCLQQVGSCDDKNSEIENDYLCGLENRKKEDEEAFDNAFLSPFSVNLSV